MDADAWSGVAGEVIDSSGNGYDGVASQADTASALLCRGADLSASLTADYLDLDYRVLNGKSDFTLMMWYQSTNTSRTLLVSGANAAEEKEVFWETRTGNRFRPRIKDVEDGSINISDIDDGTWHHLAWRRNGSANCFYVDGVQQGCTNLAAGVLDIDPTGFIIGQEQLNLGYDFQNNRGIEGLIDELYVFDTALSGAAIDQIRANNVANLNWDGAARTCSGFAATGFEISHDGAGIYCATERIGVRAIDAARDTVTAYSNSVLLDTGSGTGTWTVDTGNGNLVDLTPDNGQATYTFDPLDSGEAWLTLSYQGGAPVLDLEVSESADPDIRDDDLEGLLTFSATGFTVTANALPNPPPSPVSDPLLSRTAGTDFDVYLSAYGTTDDDPVCGVIEDYAGVRSVSIWQDWIDPVSGGITATANGNPVGVSEVGASVENLTFVNGQTNITAKYKDAGRLRINFKEGALRGATDGFVSRPASLNIVTKQTNSAIPNPQAATATGPGFVAAAEAFSLTVDVVDAEGDRTPNFGNEVAAEGLLVSAGNLVVPVGGILGSGDDGILGNNNAFIASATAGRFVNNTVFYDEVGIVQLSAGIDGGDYLGAGAVNGPLTANVGRFYPDHFAMTSSALSSSCNSFAYMSAPHVGVQAEIFARTVAGVTTQNYDTTLLGAGAVASLTPVAEYLDNGVDLGPRVNLPGSIWQQGNYSLNTTAASFARLVVPDGAYETLMWGLQVVDGLDARELDVLDMNAASSGLCTVGNTCSAKAIGFLDVFYGRLMVLPAQGPENMPLNVDLEAQIFRGGTFVEHLADQCSTYVDSGTTLGNYRSNLQLGETTVTGPAAVATLVLGHTDPVSPLQLSAPGFGNEGLVEVQLLVPDWLRYTWSGAGHEDPKADATFGLYRGHDRIIFWQQDP
jgi:MSHA biogenesis protein MshQ